MNAANLRISSIRICWKETPGQIQHLRPTVVMIVRGAKMSVDLRAKRANGRQLKAIHGVQHSRPKKDSSICLCDGKDHDHQADAGRADRTLL